MIEQEELLANATSSQIEQLLLEEICRVIAGGAVYASGHGIRSLDELSRPVSGLPLGFFNFVRAERAFREFQAQVEPWLAVWVGCGGWLPCLDDPWLEQYDSSETCSTREHLNFVLTEREKKRQEELRWRYGRGDLEEDHEDPISPSLGSGHSSTTKD